MDSVLNYIKVIFALVGGVFGWLIGGLDSIIYALIAFVVIDYITGVILAIQEKQVSSKIGFKGICKKIMIFALVAVANIIDQYVLGSRSSLRTMLVMFYVANEGISILENAVKMGLPIPNKLKEVLLQIGNKC